MNNKKYIIIGVIVVIVVAVLFGGYKIATSFMFKENGLEIYNKAHTDLIEHIKSVDDDNERKNQIEYCIEKNLITQQEANQLY